MEKTAVQTDRIIFTAGVGVISRIIQWFTRSKKDRLTPSQCAWVYYDVDFKTDCVLEANEKGFALSTAANAINEKHIVAVATSEHDLSVGFREAAKWLGSKYDFGGLFGFVWVLLGRWLRRKWHNPWSRSKALFCSEAMVRILQWSGFPGSAQLDAPTVSPEDLLLFCENSPGMQIQNRLR